MWHEARKQEKLIRGMIVDYRRRAERRKDFYEKIKAEPTQFLQLHGRPCKVHLDPAVAMAGEGPAIMMQWQGDPDNMIDRFDVRAHLDFIPEVKFPEIPVEELSQEERQCNYERYRILAQNAFLGINEDKFLQQLAIEEQFGVTLEEKETQKEKLHEKKSGGAAIGYNYNDPGAPQPSSSNGSESKKPEQKESDDDSDLEILDVDLSIDVNKMEPTQAHDLNAVGPQFGMAGCDLFSFLTGDADDAEHQKQILREEKEKAMYSGRKSRRERRAHRDKKLASRVMSPPSYAAPTSLPARSPSRSASRSPSPAAPDSIQFITSFGGEEDEPKPPLPTRPLYSEKVKQNLKKLELYSEIARKTKARSIASEDNYSRPIGPRGPNSRSVSPISSISPSKSKSRSRSPVYKKSRSRSFSRSRSSSSSGYYKRSRTRSRSRSRNYSSRRSRSHTNNSAKRNKSRSMSFESKERGAPAKSTVPRYYGRRKEDKSSSELSFESGSSDSETPRKSSVGNKSNTNQNQLRSSGSSSKGAPRDAISHKEKLKKKMQAQLARQLRADKRAEAERQERESRRQARRDEEMRELAIKLRRKQREMRHKYRPSSEESDKSRSRSSSRDSGPPGTTDRNQSRSRSNTPEEKRPPVWEHEEESYNSYKPKPPKPEAEYQSYDRKRYDQDYSQRSYYPENNLRSRSPSPKENSSNYPVWENQRQPHYPDARRKYPDEEMQEYPRYANPRGYPRQQYQNVDNRWDSNRRRPYGYRGGYRGQGRPGPSGEGPYNWTRDSQDYRSDGRNKVKLVDY